MNIKALEDLMYLVSDFFLAPVLILLVILFGYSLYALGAFLFQIWQRRQNIEPYKTALKLRLGQVDSAKLGGYPLIARAHAQPGITRDELDVAALNEMETVRTVSRLAPMLGLIATMVPMGPALKGLADGDIQGISDNLIVAFSAVIFGLVIASITFWIASVQKRWLVNELVSITPQLGETRLDHHQEPEVVHEAP